MLPRQNFTSKAEKQDSHKPECYQDKTSLQRLKNKIVTNLNATETKLQRLTNKIATNLNVTKTTSKADKQDGHKPERYQDNFKG